VKQATVFKRRKNEKLARTRRRELSLAGGSVLLHLLIFLLLPGLAVDITPQRELLINLVQARAAGQGTQVTGHSTEPEALPAPPEPESPASVDQPSPPEQPATPEPQPETANSQAKPSSPQANQATSISSAPVTVPQSPQQVQDQPVENEAVPVVDEPVAQPQPKPAKPVPAQPSQQPAPQETPAAAETGQDSPMTGPAEENSSDASADDEATPATDEGGAEGEDEEGGGEPPGPSAAELQLLGEYGDAARLRIRSQARNPEQGGEGTVTFEFEVARHGHLIDVRVIRTSGYANLDNDALEATRAAFNERAEKKPFPRDVTVASWTFVMSLKYPLY